MATLQKRIEQTAEGGIGSAGLGQMPLTLFVIVAAVIVYLHLSSRQPAATPLAIAPVTVRPGGKATVTIPAPMSGGDAWSAANAGYLGSNYTPEQRAYLRQRGPSGQP